MDAITKHKRRILTAIKVEAAKKETHVPNTEATEAGVETQLRSQAVPFRHLQCR